MIIDYLYQLKSIEVAALKYQEREAYITVLNYLAQREQNPTLLEEIREHIMRFLPGQKPSPNNRQTA